MNIIQAEEWIIKHYLLNQKLPLNKRNTPNLKGSPGIGKTAIIYSAVEKLKKLGHDLRVIKVDLAGLSEPTDVTGYQRQGYHYNGKFYTNEAVNNLPRNSDVDNYYNSLDVENKLKFNKSSVVTREKVLFEGTNKLENLLPSWWPNKNEKVIVILDDYNRCSPQLMQTVMPLVYEHSIHGIPLPQGSMIIATSNPDNGLNMVNSQDEAQDRRVLNFNVKFKLAGSFDNDVYVPGFVDYLTERDYNEQFISFVASDCIFQEPESGAEPVSGNLYENPASVERFLICVKEFCGDKIDNKNKSLLLQLSSQNFNKSLLVEAFINNLNSKKYDIPTVDEIKKNDISDVLAKVKKISNMPAAMGIFCERVKNLLKEDVKYIKKVIQFTNENVDGYANDLLPNYRNVISSWLIEHHSDLLFNSENSALIGKFYQETYDARKSRNELK